MLNKLNIGQSSRVWAKETLNQSLINNYLLHLISGDKIVQLIMYKAENVNLEGLCLAWA